VLFQVDTLGRSVDPWRVGTSRVCTAVAVTVAACGDPGKPQGAGWPAPPVLAGAQASIVDLDNVRGESVFAVLAEPTAPGPHPAVIVLHGSGGLYRLPAAGDRGTCSPELESQFVRWAERLVALGFVVMLPDSFTPRGFCDDNEDPRRAAAFPAIPADADGKTRRLLARIYDADAALAALARHANVRADAIALLGFSNGASTAALYTHHRLSDALVEFSGDADGQALGVDIPALPGAAPAVRTAIAYYPGCGFDGILPFSTDASDVGAFFYPAAPLRIEHGELDALVNHCSITRTGTRERQADAFATAMARPDHYDITIHAGAKHGFDAADCERQVGSADPDIIACRAAVVTTLERLAPLRD
jgi:dienelactone hydrolase